MLLKRTEFILDELYPASGQLETLLNDGYEIVSSQFVTSPGDTHVYYAAMLVKEETP